jgi:nucleoid-associated protein YgaU
MADFQALQQKYSPVVDVIKQFESHGAKFDGSELSGEQYHLVAHVPSKVVLERVWDEIKRVDPQYADLKHEIINTGGDSAEYTIQPGDNLSKVSKLFYGNANHYQAIAKASNIANPDKIQVGQKVTVPLL